MEELRQWFGDIFYKEITDTVTTEGYTSEMRYTSGTYELVELPYESTVTTVHQVLDYQSVAAVIFVVLTFITCVTIFRRAILGR